MGKPIAQRTMFGKTLGAFGFLSVSGFYSYRVAASGFVAVEKSVTLVKEFLGKTFSVVIVDRYNLLVENLGAAFFGGAFYVME